MNLTNLATLLGLPVNLDVAEIKVSETSLWLAVCSRLRCRVCPRCGTASSQQHSVYTRTVLDVPCAGHFVSIALRVRKFRCRNDACPQRIFAERFLDYVRPWARKTVRQDRSLSAGNSAFGLGSRRARR